MSLRHERRRRVIAEDAGAPQPIRLAAAASADDGPQLYSEAARAERLRAISTLLPISRWGILGWGLACGVAVCGCLGLHVAANSMEASLGREATAAFALDSPASLGRWLASTLLGLSAAVAMFVYALRRHRLDDYHARYRVWLLATTACVGLSLAESTRLVPFAKAIVRLAAEASQLRFDVVWPLLVTVLACGVGTRMLIEMRRNVPTLVAAALTVAAFGMAAAIHWQWPVAIAESSHILWYRASWLAGYSLLLTTLLVYARSVQLDVVGVAAWAAKPKPKKPRQAEADVSPEPPAPRKAGLKVRTDLDPVETLAVKPASETPKETKPAAVPMAPIPGPLSQRISRAERKRLRRAS